MFAKNLSLSIFYFFFLIPVFSIAQPVEVVGGYTNFEGYIEEGHDFELNLLQVKYFGNNPGRVDGNKLNLLIQDLRDLRLKMESSICMRAETRSIFMYGKNRKDGEKSCKKRIGKDARVLHPIDLALLKSESLLINQPDLTPEEVRDQMGQILLWVSVSMTSDQTHIYTDLINTVKNYMKFYHELKFNDYGQLQASNLTYNGQFQSQEQLRKLVRNNFDLSTLNPPSSAFWTNNNVEEFDPHSEKFFEMDIFPDLGEPLLYKRMGQGTIKIKAKWEAEDKDVTIRLGWETHTSVLTGRLARSIGYPSVPSAHRKFVKLKFPEGTTCESFISDWQKAHAIQMGSPATFIDYSKEGETYRCSENNKDGKDFVTLINVTFEAYPGRKRYRKMGTWRTGRNGFLNRREHRAFLIFASLISLNDTGDTQVRNDAYVPDKSTCLRDEDGDRIVNSCDWKPIFMVSDLGYSMGSFLLFDNGTTPNDFNYKIAKRKKNKVVIKWLHSDYHSSLFRNTTYSDARWMVRRLTRLSEEQIFGIVKSAGYPEPKECQDPIANIYSYKLKSRIHNLAEAFDLKGELKYSIPSEKEFRKAIHMSCPKYVNERGVLSFEAENIENSTVPLLGTHYTLFQGVFVSAYNFFRSLLSGNLEVHYQDDKDVDSLKLETGLSLLCSSEVKRNNERRGPHKRFVTVDKCRYELPLGALAPDYWEDKNFSIELPLSYYRKFYWQYEHSHTNVKQAATAKLLKSVNPLSYRSITRELAPGESLEVTTESAKSVGKLRAKLTDFFEVKFYPPLSGTWSSQESIRVSRPNNEIIEVQVLNRKKKSNPLALGVSFLTRVAYENDDIDESSDYKIYRFFINESDEEGMNLMELAFQKAVLQADYKLLDEVSKAYELDHSKQSQPRCTHLLLWSWCATKSVEDLTLGEYEADREDDEDGLVHVYTNELNRKKRIGERILEQSHLVIQAFDIRNSSRSISGFWDIKDMDNPHGLVKSAINLSGEFLGESFGTSVHVEALADEETRDFSELDIWIQIFRSDQKVSRGEYLREFKTFFSQRADSEWLTETLKVDAKYSSGRKSHEERRDLLKVKEPKYVDFEFPDGHKYLSPFKGVMKWQLQKEGFDELVEGLKTAPHFHCNQNCRGLIEKLDSIEVNGNKDQRRSTLKFRAKVMAKLLRVLIGDRSEKVALVKNYVDEKNYYMFTEFEEAWRRTVGSTYTKQYSWFGPRVGRFQGHSFLNRFSREKLIYPIINEGLSAPLGN